jgi:DNA-binding LytR/AlgR family response regulator
MNATFTIPEASVAEPELRIMVVDEPTARQRVVRLLGTMAGVRVVGEFGSGREALRALRSRAPDVVMLDISMPGQDGLMLARRLVAEHGPLVVFVAAQDEHALEAFRLHVTDYVLKPFDRSRLLDAVERARLAVRRARAERSLIGSDGLPAA